MNTARVRKFLGLLLAGAWLPATITCDPGVWSGVVHVSGYPAGVVVVEDDDWDWWDRWWGDGCCGGRDYSFDFDFEYDD